ncbi:MAG: AIR carboxylase family protein [Methanolobus sp.]|uniref:AIR carboxylase family protein n=1 Tax=Methanolobus sp. TaxID=1874737 RepID=UPI002730003E|nr:AIR carboxylase family protein [Methanolobus sp.]MDP2215905.1 AIR carboxylase family protein [Methanolobus sp.]
MVGLAAHLPGVVVAHTTKPVIGVPVNAELDGNDSLLSMVQKCLRVFRLHVWELAGGTMQAFSLLR